MLDLPPRMISELRIHGKARTVFASQRGTAVWQRRLGVHVRPGLCGAPLGGLGSGGRGSELRVWGRGQGGAWSSLPSACCPSCHCLVCPGAARHGKGSENGSCRKRSTKDVPFPRRAVPVGGGGQGSRLRLLCLRPHLCHLGPPWVGGGRGGHVLRNLKETLKKMQTLRHKPHI